MIYLNCEVKLQGLKENIVDGGGYRQIFLCYGLRLRMKIQQSELENVFRIEAVDGVRVCTRNVQGCLLVSKLNTFLLNKLADPDRLCTGNRTQKNNKF